MSGRPLTPALLGAAMVAVLVAAVLLAWPGDDAYHVNARFRDISGLREGADVRVGSVKVGTVTSLHLEGDDAVTATLAIKPAVAPVGRDATAHVRSLNLLGGKFVDLDPGDAGRAPMPSGSTIAVTRTGAPVELDQVLDVLDATTRDRLTILLNEAGTALGGRGMDLASLLRVLPGSFDKTQQLIRELASDNQALGRLLRDSNQLVGAIAPQRAALGALVDSAQKALSSVAARSRDLGATFREAPSTLEQLERTLVELDRTAGPLRPAAQSLQASAGPLTALLRAVPQAAPSVLSTLKKLRAVSPSLTELGQRGTPLVRALAPTARRLARVAAQAEPLTRTVDETTPQLLQVLEGWARAIQTRDAAGHLFRGQLTLSKDLVKALLNDYIRPPASAKKRKRTPGNLLPSAPDGGKAPSIVKPDLPELLSPVTKTIGGIVDKLLPPKSGDSGGAAARGGVTGLLDYLLKP